MHGFGVVCLFIFPFSHFLYYTFLSSSTYFKSHFFVLTFTPPFPLTALFRTYISFFVRFLFFVSPPLQQLSCSLGHPLI